jgi:hypothetical protein
MRRTAGLVALVLLVLSLLAVAGTYAEARADTCSRPTPHSTENYTYETGRVSAELVPPRVVCTYQAAPSTTHHVAWFGIAWGAAIVIGCGVAVSAARDAIGGRARVGGPATAR